MDGFWAAGSYVGIHQTVRYDEVRVVSDRDVIVEPDPIRTVHDWLAHFTLEQARDERERAGFEVLEVHGDLTGAPYEPASSAFALVATPVRPRIGP